MPLLAIAATLAVPAPLQAYPGLSPPPPTAGFRTACEARRSGETCLCMAQNLLRNGEGQFAMELADLQRQHGGDAPADAYAALLTRYGIGPDQAKAFRRAAKESLKEALGACR